MRWSTTQPREEATALNPAPPAGAMQILLTPAQTAQNLGDRKLKTPSSDSPRELEGPISRDHVQAIKSPRNSTTAKYWPSARLTSAGARRLSIEAARRGSLRLPRRMRATCVLTDEGNSLRQRTFAPRSHRRLICGLRPHRPRAGSPAPMRRRKPGTRRHDDAATDQQLSRPPGSTCGVTWHGTLHHRPAFLFRLKLNGPRTPQGRRGVRRPLDWRPPSVPFIFLWRTSPPMVCPIQEA